MVGERLPEVGEPLDLEPRGVCLKKPVLLFERLPGEDSILGPEMGSTGGVMGIDRDLGRAFARALVADGWGEELPAGTARLISLNGIPAGRVYKVHEGSPNYVDLIQSGETKPVVNTPLGGPSLYDEKAIRLAALERGVPCVTAIQGDAPSAMEALRVEDLGVTAFEDGLVATALPSRP